MSWLQVLCAETGGTGAKNTGIYSETVGSDTLGTADYACATLRPFHPIKRARFPPCDSCTLEPRCAAFDTH